MARDPLVVANRLRPVLLHLSRQLRRELHGVGLSGSQVSILAAVHGEPGVGVGELAVREGVAAPSICSHLDRLEAAGCITRTRGEGPDRRRVGLTCTPEGTRLLRTVRSRRTAWLADRLRQLSGEELLRIDGAIDALGRLLDRS